MRIQKIQVISQRKMSDINKKNRTSHFMFKCKKLPK